MAQNAANDLIWMLPVAVENKTDLAAIRHWSNLKLGFEGPLIWVKDFTIDQLNSIAVKSMPFKSVYYAKGGQLFPAGKGLPERPEPALLWTAIERALPLEFPPLNHNFFGLEEKVPVTLVVSDAEYPPFAVRTTLMGLGTFLENAPAIRMGHLEWVRVGADEALVVGAPLAPLPGKVYWRFQEALIPAGWDFEFPMATGLLLQWINDAQPNWVLWHEDGTYSIIPKNELRPLSKGAFHYTINA